MSLACASLGLIPAACVGAVSAAGAADDESIAIDGGSAGEEEEEEERTSSAAPLAVEPSSPLDSSGVEKPAAAVAAAAVVLSKPSGSSVSAGTEVAAPADPGSSSKTRALYTSPRANASRASSGNTRTPSTSQARDAQGGTTAVAAAADRCRRLRATHEIPAAGGGLTADAVASHCGLACIPALLIESRASFLTSRAAPPAGAARTTPRCDHAHGRGTLGAGNM